MHPHTLGPHTGGCAAGGGGGCGCWHWGILRQKARRSDCAAGTAGCCLQTGLNAQPVSETRRHTHTFFPLAKAQTTDSPQQGMVGRSGPVRIHQGTVLLSHIMRFTIVQLAWFNCEQSTSLTHRCIPPCIHLGMARPDNLMCLLCSQLRNQCLRASV